MKTKNAPKAQKLILSHLKKMEKKGEEVDVETMLNELSDYHVMVSEDIVEDVGTLDLQESQVSALEAGIELGLKLATQPAPQLFCISLSGPDENVEALYSDYHLAYFVARDSDEVYKRVRKYLQ